MAGAILKLGSGFLLGSTTIMLADVVDYGEFKLGTRNESIVFSVQTLLVKGASAVAGWLVGVGLSLVGYVAGEVQSATTILGMRAVSYTHLDVYKRQVLSIILSKLNFIFISPLSFLLQSAVNIIVAIGCLNFNTK